MKKMFSNYDLYKCGDKEQLISLLEDYELLEILQIQY